MGGSSGGTQVVPFNMSELAPFMPSVFNGPYNAEGAEQNEQMLAKKYPWITPPAGQFAGAQPGQFANSGSNDAPGFFGMLPFGGNGVSPAPNPNPPIPPTVPQGGSPGGGQVNPMAMSGGATNAMQPAPLQQILSVLMAGQPAGGQ